MSPSGPRRFFGIALSILALSTASLRGASASNITVQPQIYQTVKGWGGFSFIYQQPTAAEAAVVAAMGITHARIEVRPELRNSDGTINAAALAVLEGWVGASLNSGVPNYTLHVWSPPAVWKTTGNTNTGGLIAGDEQAYANWYTTIIQKLHTDGFGLPTAVSVQNEPNVDTGGAYYMCKYTDPTQLFTVIVDMRNALNTAGLNGVTVFGPEPSGFCEMIPGCGPAYMGNDPFTVLQNSTYNNALGAYAIHSYDECGIGIIKDGMTAYPKDAWETETAYPSYGDGLPANSPEYKFAVGTATIIMANLEGLPFNYWMWWSLWDPSTTVPTQTALIGQNGTTTVVGARYYLLQKLFTTVRPGWLTMHCTTDDTELLSTTVGQSCNQDGNGWEPVVDMLAWEKPDVSGMAVMVDNRFADSKTITLHNLIGTTATFYRTSSTENMAQVSTGAVSGGTYTITLGQDTVGIVVTSGGSSSPPSTPTGLTATPGNAQVALSWNTVSNATSYNLKRSTVSGSGYATVVNQGGTSYTNTGLTNGTTYYYVVSALNSLGESANSTQASATPQLAAPPAPAGLTATAGYTQAALSWSASFSATTYNLKRSTVNGSGYAAVVSQSGTTYTNTGLSNGTTYYYVVTATNAAGTSGNSNQATALPQAATLPIQINVGGPVVSPFVADVDFTGGTSGTNWTGAINTAGVTNPAPQAVYQSERFSSPAMSYAIPFLVPGASYTVRLHMCENYCSGSGQRVFSASANGVSIMSNFDIFATTGGQHIATVKQANTTADTTGVISITFVNVTNYADIDGIEILSNGGTPPPAPTGLTATPGNTQVALSWNASSGATAYDVKRSTVSGSGYVTVSSPTTTSYTNTGLTNGTTYYFVVDAKNASGTSANSSQVSATPSAGGSVLLSQGKPATASSDDGVNHANFGFDGNLGTRWSSGGGGTQWLQMDLGSTCTVTEIKINWETAAAASYQLQTSPDAITWTTIYSTTTGTSGATVDITGLNGSGRYVRVNCTALISPYGNYSLWEMQAYGSTGGGGAPPAPTGLTATPGNAQVALTWNASSGATAYDVKRSTVNGSGYVTVSSPTVTNYTNTGLTNGTTYYFVVDAKNASGTSANSSQVSATPTSGTSTLISQGKPATASSIQGTGFEALQAFDGNTTGTRWASQGGGTQWLQVDLGAAKSITEVKLFWEAAYAASFQVQTSPDSSTWTSIYSTTTGTGGNQDLTGLSGSGRYVRTNCTVLGPFGDYSLWEMQVYGF